MSNTTQTTTPDVLTISRGFGRAAARSKVGSGPHVIWAALQAARAKYPQVDGMAFVDGWQDERRDMRGVDSW